MNIINPHRHAEASYAGDGSFAMEFTTTAANTTVYLPIRSSDTSGKLVFDDGTSDVIGNPDQATHTFTNAGIYIIKYYGTASKLEWHGTLSTANKQFLTKILDWGITGATSAKFQYCSSLISVASNLESTTTDLSYCFGSLSSAGNPDVTTLDVSNVTNMKNMFQQSRGFNQDIGDWDVSSVTNMASMFYGARAFNQDLNNWDVSSVVAFNYMFFFANDFNGDISDWTFSTNSVDMRGMFLYAVDFNQDISGWDTSNVTKMAQMFQVATSFTQDISSWDTSNVTVFGSMFSRNTSANPDVSSWDTSSVTQFGAMFDRATSANPDMSSWNFSSGNNYTNFLRSSGISTTNYDGFLNRLNAQRITYSLTGRAIGDIPSTYTTSVSGAARTALLANGWTFTDDGAV